MAERLLTVAEAAELLRISTNTLYQLLANGEVPGRRIGGQWRLLASEITAVSK